MSYSYLHTHAKYNTVRLSASIGKNPLHILIGEESILIFYEGELVTWSRARSMENILCRNSCEGCHILKSHILPDENIEFLFVGGKVMHQSPKNPIIGPSCFGAQGLFLKGFNKVTTVLAVYSCKIYLRLSVAQLWEKNGKSQGCIIDVYVLSTA